VLIDFTPVIFIQQLTTLHIAAARGWFPLALCLAGRVHKQISRAAHLCCLRHINTQHNFIDHGGKLSTLVSIASSWRMLKQTSLQQQVHVVEGQLRRDAESFGELQRSATRRTSNRLENVHTLPSAKCLPNFVVSDAKRGCGHWVVSKKVLATISSESLAILNISTHGVVKLKFVFTLIQ